MALDDIFQINGTPEEQALIRQGLAKIHFPWDALRPALQQANLPKITIEFADLSSYGLLLTTIDDQRLQSAIIPPEERPHYHEGDESGEDGSDHSHILWSDQTAGLPEEGRHYVAGLAWHGKLQVEQKLFSDPTTAIVVLSSELAHEIDFFYCEPKNLHDALLDLLFSSQTHTKEWWWGVYSTDYWGQPGESWMAGFGIAYLDGAQEDSRFTYQYHAAQAEPIRQILGLPRTDSNPPPPPPPPTDNLAFSRKVIALTNVERANNSLGALVVRDMTPEALNAISWACQEGRVYRLKAFMEEAPRAALGALAEHAALMTAAQKFSEELASTGILTHTGVDGSDPGTRMARAGYKNFKTWGENAAQGQPTPEAVVAAWMNSPGHRANMLNPTFGDVGVGHAGGFTVMDFAAGDTGTPPPPPPSPTAPRLTAAMPTNGPVGTKVTLTGSGFGTAPLIAFPVGGVVTSLLPAEITDTRLVFTIPDKSVTGLVSVKNTITGQVSNGLMWTVTGAPSNPMVLTTLTPSAGKAGTTVMATGKGFGGNPLVVVSVLGQTGTTVPFRLPDTAIKARSEVSITFVMPVAVATGDVYLRNTTSGTISNSLKFTVSVVPPTALPAAPTELLATAESDKSVRLTWKDNSSDETGFVIERATLADAAGLWTLVGTLAINLTRYVDLSLTPDTEYHYRVRAKNEAGISAPSPEVIVRTPKTPPTNGSYQMVLTLKAEQKGTEWVWTTDFNVTASAGLNPEDVKPCLARQGVIALNDYLKTVGGDDAAP